MACPTTEQIAAFCAWRGELTPELAALAQHLAECSQCMIVFQRMRFGASKDEGTVEQRGKRPASGDGQPELSGPQVVVEQIGPYVLLERLGEGGMGTVYTAYHPELDRKVALKLMKAEDDDAQSAPAQARLLREAQAMAKLNHPNVVTAYDSGTYRNKVYLVMERVDGTTLKDWLQVKPRSRKEIVEVFVQAGRGLAAAHQAGLVHRDFKPANVLVGKDSRVRVTDFGLAKAARVAQADEMSADSDSAEAGDDRTQPNMGALSAPLTRADSVMGTPAYMAPEQFAGRAPDARTDQFAFCVALYEALYGQRPFPKPLRAPAPTPVREPPPGKRVPRRLRRALLRGLSLSPDGRFPSMDALLRVLSLNRAPVYASAAAAGVVLVLLGATFVVSRATHRGLPPGCEDVERSLSGVWDGSARAEVTQAFARTGIAGADVNAAASVRALDAYAQAWVEQQRTTCARASTARGDETVLLGLACLSRQKVQLQSVVEVLRHPDKETIDNAVRAAGALLPSSRCADPHFLAALPPPPKDPKVGAQVEALRFQLAAAKAKHLAGQPAACVAMLGPVLEKARALGYRPLAAEVLTALGDAQEEADQAQAAEGTLQEAERTAELAGLDLLAAEDGAMVAFVVGFDEGKLAEARPWLERARTELERGGGDALVEARIENLEGSLGDQNAQYEQALQHFQRAVTLREGILGPNHPMTVAYLNNLALEYGALCRYPDALRATQRTLDATEASTGESMDLGLFLLNEANLRVALGQLDEAERDTSRALKIFRGFSGKDSKWLTNGLQGHAELLIARGRAAEAVEVATQAAQMAQRTNGEAASIYGQTLQDEGIALELLGKHAPALAALEPARAILEKSESADTTDLVDGLQAAGAAQLGLAHPERAVPLLERALTILDKHCAPPGKRGWVQFTLARALPASNRERAHSLARSARDELAQLPWQKARLDAVTSWMKGRGLD